MVIKPVSGLAPYRWNSAWNKCMVGFARTYGVPFSIDKYLELHEFIFSLMKDYGVVKPTVQEKLTPACLAAFTAQRK